LGKDLFWFAYIYSFEWLILGIGLYLIYGKSNKWLWRFESKWSIRLLKSSWYLLLSAVAVNFYKRVDQVMIRQMVNDSANGQYSAAVRLSEIWYIFPNILCAIFFPAILNAKKQNEQLYYQRLKFLNAFLFWLALVISVIIAPLSEPLITYLYGEEYAPAGKILSYHIWSSIFVFMGVSSGYWLVAENLEKVSLYRTLVGLVVNVLLNLILIPRQGAIGAAIATLMAQSAVAVFSMLILPSARSIIWLQAESVIFPIKQLIFSRK
jgi:O-antigen/teichoic acid export membrane protein